MRSVRHASPSFAFLPCKLYGDSPSLSYPNSTHLGKPGEPPTPAVNSVWFFPRDALLLSGNIYE